MKKILSSQMIFYFKLKIKLNDILLPSFNVKYLFYLIRNHAYRFGN